MNLHVFYETYYKKYSKRKKAQYVSTPSARLSTETKWIFFQLLFTMMKLIAFNQTESSQAFHHVSIENHTKKLKQYEKFQTYLHRHKPSF